MADSLVALDLPAVRAARRVADLGSGGGFPGLALAIALPAAHVALVESVGRKCAFLATAVGELGLGNVEVVNARAEAWPEGIGAQDLVVARALAPLPVLAGVRGATARAAAACSWPGRAAASRQRRPTARPRRDALGMSAPQAISVDPFPRARDRHLYLSSKVSPTPSRIPAATGNGPQTADPSLELKVMALRRRTKRCALRPESPLA